MADQQPANSQPANAGIKSSVKHVDLLDYIRGIAILLVLLFHSLGTDFGYETLPWNGLFRDFSGPVSFLYFLPLSFGQVGVSIFFIVSGFCIHLSFQQQEQKWGGFFIRRFFRIYPPYLAALIFSVSLIMAHSGLDLHSKEVWMQWLTHLFLVHNFHPLTFYGINGSFWSLAVEVQLYLLYPALLFLVTKFGWRRTMIILAGCELLIRGADGLTQTMDAANTMWGNISWWFASSPLGYWFSWSLGAFIADAFLKNQPLPFLKISPIPWLALAMISYFIKPLFPFLFFLSAMTTAIVTSRLLSGTGPTIKVPVVSLDILKKIGLWSYSIYLLHQPLINIFSYIIVWAVPGEYRSALIVFLLLLITWLVIIPFSILWYKLFELPGIALGKRIIQKKDTRNAAMFEPERSREIHQVGNTVFCVMIGALLFIAVGSCLISAKLTPPLPAENNNLAWSLATSPDAAKRNGALAVKLAEDACQRTQYRETIMVGTLAAAYAEAGRFDDAISAAQKACELAAKNGETNLLQKNRELLSLYQNHQPYRDSQASTRK
jgi:peptidoglycan/LPS O-acetylase OafA/YrhL